MLIFRTVHITRMTAIRHRVLHVLSYRFVRFGLVGLVYLGMAQGLVATLTELVGLHYLWAGVIAAQLLSALTFDLNERWVFRRGEVPGRWVRFAKFYGVSLTGFPVYMALLYLLTESLGWHYLLSNWTTLVVGGLYFYLVCKGWVWR